MQTLLTPSEMAEAFNIKTVTLEAIVHSSNIPHTYVNGQLRFNPYLITEWMQSKPTINQATDFVATLNNQYSKMFPDTLKALQRADAGFAQRKTPKLFSLQKVKNKKHGFLLYVRYMRNGKMIRSRWNTYTKDKEAAELFAQENRERILAQYDSKREAAKTNLYVVLAEYFEVNSKYQKSAGDLGKALAKKSVSVMRNFIGKVLAPFLRSQGVRDFSGVTPLIITKLQVHLLKKGNKPQTVNQYLGAMKTVFNSLIVEGMQIENPFDRVKSLKCAQTKKTHGCYELAKVYGVFSRRWYDELSRLLNMIIYCTNIRNCEIERIQVQDIIKIGAFNFIDIPDPSRTKNKYSVRVVPLHPVVYKALMQYIRKNNLSDTDYIFSKDGTINQSIIYRTAYQLLGKKLGYTPDDLRNENISFYSGRHYWKTLMSANGLGDADEFFMGHKVSSNMAELYNHRDKQGQKALFKKTKEVFAILDKTVFK